MKNAIFAMGLSLFCLQVSAVTINNSKVSEVTVYRNFAKETRLASDNLNEGVQEVIISNVSPFMDENTIQIATKGNVKILSVSSRNNFLSDKKKTDVSQKLSDSLKLLNNENDWIAEQIAAYQGELEVLDNNKKLANDKLLFKSTDVKDIADFYIVKALEIRRKLLDLVHEQTANTEIITRITQQINDIGNQQKSVKEIVLKVNALSATAATFKCSYVVSSAYWMPVYDIRAKNLTEPLQVDCKAKVVQNTGMDWKDIKLKLSTANPASNQSRPVLYPLYVDFFQPDYYYKKMESKISGVVAAPQMMQNSMDIARSGMDKEEFTDGLRADDNGVTLLEGETTQEYDIQTLQDIESDNQAHIVGIQEIKMQAVYNYHAVPKLDPTAYLLARVTDWAKYNLLAGEANIFFDDSYVGKSYLNPNVSADTLLISLGRDEKINIKRIKLNDYTSTKIIGNKKREQKAFETTVKNNKNTAIEIEILDQYPISQNKDIEVSLDETSGAQLTEDFGKVIWKVKLQPNETKKFKLIYTIKYPEDKKVQEKN